MCEIERTINQRIEKKEKKEEESEATTLYSTNKT